MKIAIIDKKDITLKIENSSIKIDSQTIPFKLVDMLVLNHRAILKSGDILKLTKNDISILLVSYNNIHTSIISSSDAKASALKLAQYRSLENSLNFAKYFISKKIISHTEHLKSLNIDINSSFQIMQINNAKNSEEIMGIEGSFAREYFSHYFKQLPKSMHKSKRTKRPPLDPVNALLSFWYSMYYNIITIKLLSYGFETGLGYLHTPFRTHHALSSDILELFRAEINHIIIKIFTNKVLTNSDFSYKNGVYLKYEGRQKTWKEFVSLVDILKPKLDSVIADLKRMIAETDNHNKR
jgi:CRISPR-associated protein Cas1